MKYYVVDAFTDRAFGGNPAGVVILEEDIFPDENLMRLIAAELRYSETAFVRRHSATEYTVRYFTPTAEVELCGHATIATFSLLHSLGLAEGRCLCHTLAGDLAIEAGERVLMQMASPRIVTTIADTPPLYDAVGLSGYRPQLPVQVAYAGLPDIMMQVENVTTLNTLRLDMDAISSLTGLYDVTSFHVFAFADDEYTAHVRDFGPRFGVPEESATGTANAALTHYLAVNGVIGRSGDFSFLQGEAMCRPSVVSTRLATDGTLYVGGRAYVLAEGRLAV